MGDVSIADVSSAESAEPRQLCLAGESAWPLHAIGQPEALTLKALPNGCLYAIEYGDILINQVLASPLAGGIHRIFLRFLRNSIQPTQIVGPHARSEFIARSDRFSWRGSCHGVTYHCHCWLPSGGNTWVFQVEIQNDSQKNLNCDAILVQDIGLATRAQVRNNERYTSQYLDHSAISHERFGHLLMTRQNLPQPEGTHPWLLQGCFPKSAGFCTDGIDFFGSKFKENGIAQALSQPCIGDRVRQHESGYVAMQGEAIALAPGRSHVWCFFARYSPDHPPQSSAADVDARELEALRHACKTPPPSLSELLVPTEVKTRHSLFQSAPLFDAEDLDESEIRSHFPGEFRHEEFVDARRHSFFLGDDSRHVVLKSKEVALARPHGHIMRSGQGLMPDAEVMSCTCYAAGIFASQVAVGNTVFGKFLSGVRDPFNIVRSSGLRIFVRRRQRASWELLGVPSALELAPNFCRWYYKNDRDLLTVTCTASDEDPAFSYVVRSRHDPVELLICGEISAGPQEYDTSPRLTIDSKRSRITIRPDPTSSLAQRQPEIAFHIVSSTPHAISAFGGDELLASRSSALPLPYFAIRTHSTTEFSFSFVGAFDNVVRAESHCTKYESLGARASPAPVDRNTPSNSVNGQLRIFASKSQKASQLSDALAWMARDAMIHFTVPRGLEQANGGAWGVRDVCQGPIEFLLAHDRADTVKTVVEHLFSQQFRERGDWPQWFMFPPFQQVRSRECHGDILIWPLKALCDYLENSDDGAILHQALPYTHDETFDPDPPAEPILEHVDKLIGEIERECLPGLSLPCYGEGDWDDSLQPVSPERAQRMVSSWTVALLFQTLSRYAVALSRFGENDRAERIATFADRLQADFQRYLVPDGVVAGFAVFGSEPGQIDHYLLHPSDRQTGLHYRLISMTRGILSGIFTPEQAVRHIELVKKHLVFADGARLMDRPTTYRGGEESIFRRSESASFFGREIGLQYVHAHLRYAEALATLGDSQEVLHALMVANPIAVTDVVANALPRQRNCYFSSSDAAFMDRYEATRDYEKLRNGQIPVDGGWRIYSSGPGIYTNLVIRHLFGLRKYFDSIDFDPVLPAELDGICCDLPYNGRKVRYEFSRSTAGGRARCVIINGVEQRSTPITNSKYRVAGVRISKHDFEAALTLPQNVVRIEM